MTSAVADPTAREFLREADPVLRELIDTQPDFRPRAWLDALSPLDAFRAPNCAPGERHVDA